jgi:hypothetical protein
MRTHSIHVPDVTAARAEVDHIAIKSLRHRDWFSINLVTATVGESLRAILSLPEIENASTICFLKVVGVRDALCPVAALSVGNTCYPGAGRPVSSIA